MLFAKHFACNLLRLLEKTKSSKIYFKYFLVRLERLRLPKVRHLFLVTSKMTSIISDRFMYLYLFTPKCANQLLRAIIKGLRVTRDSGVQCRPTSIRKHTQTTAWYTLITVQQISFASYNTARSIMLITSSWNNINEKMRELPYWQIAMAKFPCLLSSCEITLLLCKSVWYKYFSCYHNLTTTR